MSPHPVLGAICAGMLLAHGPVPCPAAGAGAAMADPPAWVIERASYEDHLRGMWLGSAIANWTGLKTEGRRQAPPFYTDADWPNAFDGASLGYVLDQAPWKSDDDTDIEYIYARLLEVDADNRLSGEQIRDAWVAHIDPEFVWVSNARALELMNEGVWPPGTGQAPANGARLKIDAQLTTEMIGAMAPGMPRRALEMADLPILTTARSHAAYASQFFVVMHALAPRVDRSLSGREQAIWLVERARRWVPDGSKTADIADHVLADFLANPDPTDWERTRDLVYQRYQADSVANGFFFRGFTESSVNFGTGLICLLYGEMDFLETVRIGTLGGWDSDNPTATMGGLIGLVKGREALIEEIRQAYPGFDPSDEYDVERTRDNYPPLDTFSAIASRMATVAEREVTLAGGLVDGSWWLLPPAPEASGGVLELNPRWAEHVRSARQELKEGAEFVNGSGSGASAPSIPSTTYGRNVAAFFFNGLETDFSGTEPAQSASQFYSSQGAVVAPGATFTLEVRYPRSVSGDRVRFIEGAHFHDGASGVDGGWFDTIGVEVRLGSVWTPVGVTLSEPLDPRRAWQTIDLVFDDGPVDVTGIRVVGLPGGEGRFVTASEIDLLAPPVQVEPGSVDIDHNGRIDVEDLYSWWSGPVDLDADGVAGPSDAALVEAWIRWSETKLLLPPDPAPATP